MPLHHDDLKLRKLSYYDLQVQVKTSAYVENNIIVLQKFSINVEQIFPIVQQLRQAQRRVRDGHVGQEVFSGQPRARRSERDIARRVLRQLRAAAILVEAQQLVLGRGEVW